MKIRLTLSLVLLSVACFHAIGQDKVPPASDPAKGGEGVKVGDYVWRGVQYRDARVSRTGDVILISSAQDGTARIPVNQVPADLVAKLPVVPPSSAPTGAAPVTGAPGIFNLLGASESQLTGQYGAPKPSTGVPIAPATKFLVYESDELQYHAHLLNDKTGVLLVTRDTRGLPAGKVAHILARCGSGWTKEAAGRYRRKDGSTAVEQNGELLIKSGAFLTALATHEAGASQKKPQ